MESGHSKETHSTSHSLNAPLIPGTVTRSYPFELESSKPLAHAPSSQELRSALAAEAHGTPSLRSQGTIVRKPSMNLGYTYGEASPARSTPARSILLLTPKEHLSSYEEETSFSKPSCCECLFSLFKSHHSPEAKLIKAKEYSEYISQSKSALSDDEGFDEDFYIGLKP